jgi:hypothetical protein
MTVPCIPGSSDEIVAVRNVVQQIAGGDDAESSEGFGPYRTNAFEIRYAGVQKQPLPRS